MSKAIVFLGPTLSLDEARGLVKAEFLPPVSQGDIVTLLEEPPEVIGIIDGYFERIPAVWHKEILLALSLGVRVLGASSMGALRAAELHPFGMVGVGEIFARYRDGLLVDDDAVAIQHGPAEAGYQALSEALVNLQASLESARETALLSKRGYEALAAAAKKRPYWERSYETLLADGHALGVPAGELDAFAEMPKIDQKALDARAMLRRMKEPPGEAPKITPHRTMKLESLIDRDRCLWRGEGVRITVDTLINSLRLTGRSYLELRKRAQAIQKRLARLDREPVADQAASQAFRAHLGVMSGAELARWRTANGLSEAAYREHVGLWQALRATPPVDPAPDDEETLALCNDDLILQLRLENSYQAHLARAVAIEQCYAQAKPGEAQRLGDEALYRLYRDDFALDRELSFSACGKALGFSDAPSFAFWLTKFHLYCLTKTDSEIKGVSSKLQLSENDAPV
ncbi:MAG: TfuA-like protein [Pseudomonadota bacterium]